MSNSRLALRILTSSAAATVLLTAAVVVHAGAPSRKSALPNIVLFMADDMGLGDTSAYQDFTGNKDADQIATPSMKRLARMGVRFTDAHTPSSRCTSTRYGLLTGRYAWRSRMKHFVLFGSQGDPLIEPKRPTLATVAGQAGYRCYLVGKWHVGLRYRQATGDPAAGWDDADLTKPLADGPLDHGFHRGRFTSRSHGTSGPHPRGKKKRPSANHARQTIGPGHIHGRNVMAATTDGKRLADGEHAYRLSTLGGRHSDSALTFLREHVIDDKQAPFFLYYAANSNHSPYTPDKQIGELPVRGAGKSVAGKWIDDRADFVFENDVALGRLMNFLSDTNDPRRPGRPLIENTVVIFTSDNGAERNQKTSTGPFRSNKGSAYEGGHRVPFLVSWPLGGVGDGDASTVGVTSHALIGLQDLFATMTTITRQPMPNCLAGEIGGEDSVDILPDWQQKPRATPHPIFFNDHREAKDPAAVAFRLDDPDVGGQRVAGQWKLFCDARLLRLGIAAPTELYELKSDSREQKNRIDDPALQSLVQHLKQQATSHRTAGGHALARRASGARVVLDWRPASARKNPSQVSGIQRVALNRRFENAPGSMNLVVDSANGPLRVSVRGEGRNGKPTPGLHPNANGLGVYGGKFLQVDDGEAIVFQFDRDVLIEHAEVVAGNGQCGGFCQVGKRSPVAIYCIDGDNDSQDQRGVLSDLGVLPAGQPLRLSSAAHWGVEPAGRWRLGSLALRVLPATP